MTTMDGGSVGSPAPISILIPFRFRGDRMDWTRLAAPWRGSDNGGVWVFTLRWGRTCVQIVIPYVHTCVCVQIRGLKLWLSIWPLEVGTVLLCNTFWLVWFSGEQGNCCWFSYCSMAYGGPSAIWLQVCIVDRFYVIFPRFSVFIAWLLLVHISLLPYLLLVYIYIYVHTYKFFFIPFESLLSHFERLIALRICPGYLYAPIHFTFSPPKAPHNSKLEAAALVYVCWANTNTNANTNTYKIHA